MESIIFIAPPAAGKGTLSSMLKEKYHLPHISTGDLLRDTVKEATEDAKMLKQQMEAGVLISDDVILNLLMKRISESDCDNGYILDGFPRNISQAMAYEKILEKLGKALGKVIYVSVDKSVALARIVGRQSCPTCKAVYNDLIDGAKPLKTGICDKCGSHLTKRNDDNVETFNVRFDTYLKSTEPLIHYYENLGVLYKVENNINKEVTFKNIEDILTGGN